jgi:hypothetical protein
MSQTNFTEESEHCRQDQVWAGCEAFSASPGPMERNTFRPCELRWVPGPVPALRCAEPVRDAFGGLAELIVNAMVGSESRSFSGRSSGEPMPRRGT